MKITGMIVKVEAFRVLVVLGPRRAWLPRAEIRNLAEIRTRPENGRYPEGIPVGVPLALSLPGWLAERKFGASPRRREIPPYPPLEKGGEKGMQAGKPAPPKKGE